MRKFLPVFIVMLVSCNGWELKYCENDDSNDPKVDIVNFKEKPVLTWLNPQNRSSYSLSVEISWDVNLAPGDSFDGFIMCEREVVSPENYSLVLPERRLLDDYKSNTTAKSNFTSASNFDGCRKYIGKEFWRTDSDGVYRSCPYPCERYYKGCYQSYNDVCSLLVGNCVPLNRNQRNMTIGIEFGKLYYYQIVPYKEDKVLYGLHHFHFHDILFFCTHHLIEEEKMSRDFADEFCQDKKVDENVDFACSQISGFDFHYTRDFDKNETNVVLQWTKPHEIRSGGKMDEYYVYSNSSGINFDKQYEKAKTPEEEAIDPIQSYKLVFKGVTIPIPLLIQISPYVEVGNRSSFGDAFAAEIFVPGFDPCQNGSDFCVSFASCNYSKYQTVLKNSCTCPVGYVGNGISNSVMSDATGCTDLDACLGVGLFKCVPLATCVDARPPSLDISRCVCEPGYFGDGQVNGNGCITNTVIIISSVVATLILLGLIVAIIFFYRKNRKRSFDSTLRQYVTKSSNHYSSSFDLNLISNNSMMMSSPQHQFTEPVFGRKLEINRKRISNKEIIGRGNFGIVHRALLKTDDEDEEIVAVKSLSDPHSPEYTTEFLAEMSLFVHLGKHENILSVIGVCTIQPPNLIDSEHLSPLLITEYMVYGDLLHLLWKAREPEKSALDPVYNFTESSLYSIGQQVAHGMEYLRQSRIIHGDLAARNILVGQNLKVKISDFGLANDVYRYGFIKGAIERKIPFCWISPERMSGGKSPITWKSDVWSFGILLYEMVTLGASPYPSMDRATIYVQLQNGYRMPQPTSCSDRLYQIMLSCWEWEAVKRPTFKHLKKKFECFFDFVHSKKEASLLSKMEDLHQIDQSSYKREIEIKKPITTCENGSIQTTDSLGIQTLSGSESITCSISSVFNGQTNEGFVSE